VDVCEIADAKRQPLAIGHDLAQAVHVGNLPRHAYQVLLATLLDVAGTDVRIAARTASITSCRSGS
jgi:hypothetical protein